MPGAHKTDLEVIWPPLLLCYMTIRPIGDQSMHWLFPHVWPQSVPFACPPSHLMCCQSNSTISVKNIFIVVWFYFSLLCLFPLAIEKRQYWHTLGREKFCSRYLSGKQWYKHFLDKYISKFFASVTARCWWIVNRLISCCVSVDDDGITWPVINSYFTVC